MVKKSCPWGVLAEKAEGSSQNRLQISRVLEIVLQAATAKCC
jgi:hypothetical protein